MKHPLLIQIRRQLAHIPVDAPAEWNSVSEALQQLLGNPVVAGLYSFSWNGERAAPALAAISQVSRSRAFAHVDWILNERKLTFDPLNVARADRNRVATAEDLLREGRAPANLRSQLEVVGQKLRGVRTPEQIRVLISDGNTLLAWVGAIGQDPAGFGKTQRLLLRALVPDLRKRLLFEQRIENALLRSATLEATLEALVEPVFVVSASGRPVIMNTGARGLWGESRGAVAAEIHDALKGDGRNFRVSAVVGNGIAAHWLLVRNVGTASVARQSHAQRSWGLTSRESAVLGLVAEGKTNASIARDLSCAERTVELHVTRLLNKARVANRASLVARFWSGK